MKSGIKNEFENQQYCQSYNGNPESLFMKKCNPEKYKPENNEFNGPIDGTSPDAAEANAGIESIINTRNSLFELLKIDCKEKFIVRYCLLII